MADHSKKDGKDTKKTKPVVVTTYVMGGMTMREFIDKHGSYGHPINEAGKQAKAKADGSKSRKSTSDSKGHAPADNRRDTPDPQQK